MKKQREPLRIETADEISVAFYGQRIKLKREHRVGGVGHCYRLYDPGMRNDHAEVGEPSSRRLELSQAGTMNTWCADFRLNSPSQALVNLESWGDSPQLAVRKLVNKMQKIVGLIGWS